MAKGRKGKGSGRAVSGVGAQGPEALLGELKEQVGALAELDDAQQGPAWGAVHRLLLRTDADRADIGRVVARRDLGELQALLASLTDDAPDDALSESSPPASDESAPDVPETAAADVDDETMKKAMRAFRKRMKLTRLDHESRLGVGPLSGGKKADVDAIMAPREFPEEVWEALVEAGQLSRAGRGFYMLPPQ